MENQFEYLLIQINEKLNKIEAKIDHVEERLDSCEEKIINVDSKSTRTEAKVTNFLDVNGVSTSKDGSLSDKKQTIFVEYNEDGHTSVSLMHDDVRLSVLKKFLSNRFGTFELKFKTGEVWKITK